MDFLFLKVLVQIFNAWFLSKPTVGPYVVEFKSSGIFNNEVTGPTEPSNISCGALKIPQSQGLKMQGIPLHRRRFHDEKSHCHESH